MSRLPRSSPWGEVHKCEVLIDGVFDVSTAGHGGIMVRKNAADFLSPEAKNAAMNERNYLCYEEDCDASIVIRELLDKNLWQIPDRYTDKAKYEDNVNQSLQRWNPEYWETRQGAVANILTEEKKPPTLADRLEAGKARAAAHNAERTMPDIPKKAKSATEH